VVPTERGNEASGRQVTALIRARVLADRDRGVAEPRAIEARLVEITNGIAPASGSTGWTFSTLTYLRTQPTFSGKEIDPVVEFEVIATK
jgi:hypothetical protein